MSSRAKAFLFLGFLLISSHTAKSQATAKSAMSNNLLGTWLGIIVPTNEKGADREPVKIVWRIHSIDNLKKQVELTDMRQRIFDGSEIENPKKSTYKGSYTDSVFVIEFDSLATSVKFNLKFKRDVSDERPLLQGKAVTNDNGNRKEVSFNLLKINDDTSKYVTPKKGSVEVTIMPPL
jgi:hypothetical protein